MSTKLFVFFTMILLVESIQATDLKTEKALFWWAGTKTKNFGDELSPIIVERLCNQKVRFDNLKVHNNPVLFAVGSVIHFARDNDVIWGSGFRENPLLEKRKYQVLDVRCVRGPRTRNFLLQMDIPCPKVYGDPALLLPILFPEFQLESPIYDYIIIPNLGDIPGFLNYKNVVLPTEPWDQVVRKILKSKLVISSSLHGIIVAEAFGVPARLLKMTWIEPLLKYQDYYESTGRTSFRYATSVREALQMGGEFPIAPQTKERLVNELIASFPYDYFLDK